MFQFLSKLYFLQNVLSLLVSLISPVLVHNLGKYFALKKAFYLTALEDLQGDYLEFGVFTGSSFVCALNCSKRSGIKNAHRQMRFFGFDSFEGFGELPEFDQHPFYKDLNFETSYQSVNKRLLKAAGSRRGDVVLVKGFFDDTLNQGPQKYGINKASIILIDNDTHSAALDCLSFCTQIVQEGTILIADDSFSYRGSEKKGVHGAIATWLEKNPYISLRKVSDYGMGGEIFIVSEVLTHG
jgi:O-methyltransferase